MNAQLLGSASIVLRLRSKRFWSFFDGKPDGWREDAVALVLGVDGNRAQFQDRDVKCVPYDQALVLAAASSSQRKFRRTCLQGKRPKRENGEA